MKLFMGLKNTFLLLAFSATCLVACSQRQLDTTAAARNEAQDSSPEISPTPEMDLKFGQGLSIVHQEINLKSEKLRYEIHVTYPQIEGRKSPRISTLNRQIKRLVSDHYRWPLHPTAKDLSYYREKHPDIFNTIDLSYETLFATDKLLSIYFEGFSYGIGAAHSVQYSFTVNYDLKSEKLLRLADIFKPDVNYLQFVSQYCTNDLARQHGTRAKYFFTAALEPKVKNYQSWNVTKEGIRINFDACSALGCSDGKQSVTIPFAEMKEMLNEKSQEILTMN